MTVNNNVAHFPDTFLWGASTAAFLMEGSERADGAGSSIQHTYARTPGNRPPDWPGEDAIDHYGRQVEDVELMKELGLRSYRFSISWPRVFPAGTGRLNRRGLDHYDRLVDALLAAGIEPFPYLYVWDLPAALQDRGGWANRDCAGWFADYAALVFDRLGDRVCRWLTICEPWSIVHFGHVVGSEAPGLRDLRTALRAGHHLLLGHGEAVRAFRASGRPGEIGLGTVMTDIHPASGSEEDRCAAERAAGYFNRLYLDPVLLGVYPPEMVERFGAAWPDVTAEDLVTIASPTDFLGVVYYLRLTVADRSADSAPGPETIALAELLDIEVCEPRGPVTELGWEIAPDGLTRSLEWIRDRYRNPPVYVAENGACFPDAVGEDGGVDDPDRRRFLRDHLAAAHRAIRAGVDLRGWSVWSLLDDNVSRFGLVHVDYETQRRTIKSSGRWYRDVIAANGFGGE